MYLRLLLRRWTPPFTRALLIESGSRSLLENFIPWIYAHYGASSRVDVVTCYGGAPKSLDPSNSTVYHVTDYQGPEGRAQLLNQLLLQDYTVATIICSAEPIMTKWKWWLAWKLPVKVLVLNENGDFFWIDRTQWKTLLHFAFFRAGLTGASALPTIGRLMIFPLSLTYLILFAGWVHTKRAVRLALARS